MDGHGQHVIKEDKSFRLLQLCYRTLNQWKWFDNNDMKTSH
jgi:hypothetical protein